MVSGFASWYQISSLGLLCLVVICSLGCQDAAKGIAVDISITDSEIEVNGTKLKGSIQVPQLESALGLHDRVVEAARDIYIWDSYGVYAFTKSGNKVINELTVAYENQGLQHSPTSNFGGGVTIAGNAFKQRTAQKHFLKNGFEANANETKCAIEIGRREIAIEHDESLSVIQTISFRLQ